MKRINGAQQFEESDLNDLGKLICKENKSEGIVPIWEVDLDGLNLWLREHAKGPHGTYRYTKGCRCDICKEARARSMRKHRSSKARQRELAARVDGQ